MTRPPFYTNDPLWYLRPSVVDDAAGDAQEDPLAAFVVCRPLWRTPGSRQPCAICGRTDHDTDDCRARLSPEQALRRYPGMRRMADVHTGPEARGVPGCAGAEIPLDHPSSRSDAASSAAYPALGRLPMDHERHVTHVLRGVAQTLMLHRRQETPDARQRLAYLVDDVTRGRVSPMRHDAEQLAAAFVLRLGAWQFRDLKTHVLAAYHQLAGLAADARLVVLSVAVDELTLPHRGEAERAAVAQALAVIATLVPPECYRADSDVDDALRGGA